MSTVLKYIYKLYEELDNNKSIVSEILVTPSEAMYPNLKFAKRTRQDQISKALLDDLQKATEMTGLDITIDFAKTGHGKYAKSGNVSRHWSQQAVDIDFIDGKVVSPKNRQVVDKFVNALLSMGYNKNAEGKTHPKAVLTFGFAGHDDHVHVSNTTDTASSVDPNYVPSDNSSDMLDDSYGTTTSISGTNTTKQKTTPDFITYQLAQKLGSALGLKENFGKNIKNSYGTISIPGSSNPKIYSPIDGVVNNSRFISGCKNQILIEYEDIEDNKNKYYLQYCGISKPKVKDGESVSEGQIIGLMDRDDDAEVLMLDSSYQRKNINPKKIKSKTPEKNSKDKKDYYKKDSRTYWDPAMASLILAPKKIFGNVYDKDTGKLKTRKWSNKAESEPVDPWILNAIKKPFQKKKEEEKIQENIKRIKGLL
jgi:hypothetical protein